MANVLLTGCRGGIALDAAKRLARNGHSVYATVHTSASVDETRSAFSCADTGVRVSKLDILCEQDRQLAAALPVDVLVNNAAVGDSGPMADISVARLRTVFETNLFETLALTQLVMKKMIANGGGRVIFIGSIAGLVPMPFLAPYSMTKFALEGLVYALRHEVKPFGIDVVMVNPGGYHTGFNQKNMMKKYEWMDEGRYSDKYLAGIRKEEERLARLERKCTRSIAKQIVRAVQSRHPKKRYAAPLWQWLGVPLIRRLR